MRRYAGTVVGVLLAALVVAAPPIPGMAPNAGPQRTDPSLAVCHTIEGAGRTSSIEVAGTASGLARATVFVSGEAIASTEFTVDRSGGGGLAVSDLAPVGVAAVAVETPSSVAGVSVITSGESSLAAGSCGGVPGPMSVVGGASTVSGNSLDLSLVNPFAGEALVNVNVSSESGLEGAPALTGLVVPPLSTISFDIAAMLPARERLTFAVESTQGLVAAHLTMSNGVDAASWSGVEPAEDWYLALPPFEERLVVISSASAAELSFQIDVYAAEGVMEAYQGGAIGPRGEVMVDLAEFSGEAIGVRVIATGPVGVSGAVMGESGLAIAPAVPAPATGWLAAGAGSLGDDSVSSVVILNTGIEVVDVTVASIGGPPRATTYSLEPGSVRLVELTVGRGALVDATGEVVAGWFAVSPRGLAWDSPRSMPDG